MKLSERKVEWLRERRAREEQRIRDDLDALIERVRDSEMPDRGEALSHLGRARGWLRVREEHTNPNRIGL